LPNQSIALTSISHGGGCGCKISPGILRNLLQRNKQLFPPQLLVGLESGDDAAVYRINAEQAIVATTDFFTPIVDDAYDFGRIAANNALSDIYAMGGQPLFALAIVGIPIDKIPMDDIRSILAGGQAVCNQAGIPVAGGHSIDNPEPVYGLVVIGLVHPDKIKRNCSAQAGDVLILSKPLGIGILSAAIKKKRLSQDGLKQMLRWTTQLNKIGQILADQDVVHAMTDVTGFGLAGHLLEICQGSQLAAEVDLAGIPVIPEAQKLLQQGIKTAASRRNWQSYGEKVNGIPQGFKGDQQRDLITDPQTNGGLLLACAAKQETQILSLLREQGLEQAKRIGQLSQGQAQITIVPEFLIEPR